MKRLTTFPDGCITLLFLAVLMGGLLGCSAGDTSNREQTVSSAEPGSSMSESINRETEKPDMVIHGRIVAPTQDAKSREIQQRPGSGALVYISDGAKPDSAPPEEPLTIRLDQGRVEPTNACAIVGQEVVFEAVDGEVYDLQLAHQDKYFLIVRISETTPSVTRIFSEPVRYIRIICPYRPPLWGYLTVVANRHFALSAADGTFQLPEALPPGQYEIIAWHPDYGHTIKKFEIPPDGTQPTIDFVLLTADERDFFGLGKYTEEPN